MRRTNLITCLCQCSNKHVIYNIYNTLIWAFLYIGYFCFGYFQVHFGGRCNILRISTNISVMTLSTICFSPKSPVLVHFNEFVPFYSLDTCISSLLEAALSGNEEQKPFDCTVPPDLSFLVDLALSSSKEPANSLWINMQDYAISKGLPSDWAYNEHFCLYSKKELWTVTDSELCFLLQIGTPLLSVMNPY